MISSDRKTLFMHGSDAVYSIPLTLRGATMADTSLVASGFSAYGLATWPFLILTEQVSGNNYAFANYLNTYAPSLNYLFSSYGSTLEEALESASPLRNTFASFASEQSQLAISQTLTSHLQQIASKNLFRNALPWDSLAYLASCRFPSTSASVQPKEMSDEASCPQSEIIFGVKPSGYWEPWLSALGGYIREKAQSQTPAFEITPWGVLAAVDYHGPDYGLVGGGAGYVFSHLHEKQGAGYANIQQGFVTCYGQKSFSSGYINLAIWGSYYNIHNVRKIQLPTLQTKAKSKPHGWQLTPHIDLGWTVKCAPQLYLVPFASADWVNFWEKGVNEHGAGVLNMGQKGRHGSLLQVKAGMMLQQIVPCSWGIFQCIETGGYVYQNAFDTGKISAFVISGASPGTFTVTAFQDVQHLGSAELDLGFFFTRAWVSSVFLNYQGQFGSSYLFQQGSFGISKSF